MIWRVVLTDEALSHIARQRDWIAMDSPDGANRWVEEFYRALAKIERLPRKYRRAPEQRVLKMEVRQMLFYSHRVIYIVDEPEVRIIAVRHAARRPMRRGDQSD